MAQGAGPPSSPFTNKWIYDVFLNFRGKDTRHGFTHKLYNSLCQNGIHTFIDNEELKRGEEITPALLKAIQYSRIAIIVFSINYASSSFCLDELVKILECSKEEGRLVFPIFYDVDPSQVRHQTGTYSQALAKHEERFKHDNDKVKKWRKALYEAANLSGWHFQYGSQPEYKFVQEIVKEVSKKINCIPLHVADKPIGLENAVLEVKSLIGHGSDARVNMIGIYGVGGIGKSTIARALYNLIFSQFEGMCFLPDIREKVITKHGLVQLQQMLLSEILEKHVKVRDVNRGIPIIKRRLHQKKVLLVLDDVDDQEQLKVLARKTDWFGSGSIIIITTRDKHLLATHGVERLYEVKPLNDEKALELFNWHAFKNYKVDPHYVNISKRAISYACGLPLALEVIGSHLFGKSLTECSSALDKYESIPHEKIHEMLKVSYDGLGENEKGIFLDIACFFNTYEVGYVTRMLHAHGFHLEDGLRVLVDRSLIKIDASGFVRIHDLIRDMGREIVRQESTLEPGTRSRLWFDEDIVHVLEENTGTDKIEFIKLEGYNNIQVQWNGKAFKKMKNLRILIIRNAIFSTGPKHLPNSLRVLHWSCYPSSSFPSNFNPKHVEILHMPKSCLKIFQPHQVLKSLSTINFEGCRLLTDLPSLREVPCLTDLCLDWCTNLVKIDGSIGFLPKLRKLSAYGCTKLKILAPCIMLTSLEILDLQRCSSLESFPEVLGKMEKIRKVYIDETAIESLPLSIGNLVGVELLSLQECKRLHQLPVSIHTLPKVGVRLSDRPWTGYKVFKENQDEEVLCSEVSPRAMLIHSDYYYLKDIKYLDVYYHYVSPNNVIQVCSPNPHMHSDMELLFHNLDERKEGWHRGCDRSSMRFLFRNKFPMIALCCSIRLLSDWEIFKLWMFKFSVLINGTKQFSSSCNYISDVWYLKLWCDLQCKADKGMFSEHEWNEAEILFEFKYPGKPPSPAWEIYNASGSFHWTMIGVYEEGNNKDDIQFKNPMSTFTFPNRESSSSLPNCLYYDFSLGG